MPLYTFGDAAGSSSDERGNSREASNEDEDDGYDYDENGALDEEDDYEDGEDGLPNSFDPQKGVRLSPMMVYVETLTGTAFEVRVSSFEAVISIKDKIQRLEGIPISQQHLLYDNCEMRDNYTLREYNIRNGATLKLVLGMRGGPINTRRVPVEEPVLRDIDLMEAKEQLSRKLNSSSNNHFTILVLRNGQQVNLYRVVDRNDGSAPSSASSSGSRCEKVRASVGTTRAQKDTESDDEDDEDDTHEDQSNNEDEDESDHDEPTRMAVKLANLRMKMHQRKTRKEKNLSLKATKTTQLKASTSTALPPIKSGQSSKRQNTAFEPSSGKTSSSLTRYLLSDQTPMPRYLQMKSLHGNFPDENSEISIGKGDMKNLLTDSRTDSDALCGTSKSDAEKANERIHQSAVNHESSMGIMPRTSYAVSQIIDPSAELSNYNLVRDKQAATSSNSSGQIIGGPSHSLAKSLYNRDPVSHLTATEEEFSKMRMKNYDDCASGDSKAENYALKSMPVAGAGESTHEDKRKGQISENQQEMNSDAAWLQPPDKNFDAFKIAQDILQSQGGTKTKTIDALNHQKDLQQRINRSRAKHYEEDFVSIDAKMRTEGVRHEHVPILTKRKKNLKNLFVETDLNERGESSQGFNKLEELKNFPPQPGKISQLKGKVVNKPTPSPTESTLSQKHHHKLTSMNNPENRIPSHQRQQQPRSRQNTSGGGFHVENLTNADLAELKYFSSILDRAAAKGKLSRISPTATAEPTSNKHSPSNSKGANFAGQSTFQPVSSNTSSKAKRNSTVQPIPPPFPRTGPLSSDLRIQHPSYQRTTAISPGTSVYTKQTSHRLPSATHRLPGNLKGATTTLDKDVSGFAKVSGLTSNVPVDIPVPKKPRCFVCGKKTRIGATYSCRCEGVFCAQHRYAESHDCTYDYKSEGKKLLEYTNPVVTAPKLPKI